MSAGDFHLALLAKAYQAWRGTFASGCFAQKAWSVVMTTIRMVNDGTKLGSLQESFLPILNSSDNFLSAGKPISDGKDPVTQSLKWLNEKPWARGIQTQWTLGFWWVARAKVSLTFTISMKEIGFFWAY